MTGYAGATHDLRPGTALSLTIRSVNHRFLDLNLRLAPGCEALEPTFRAELKRALARGHVELTLTVDRSSSPGTRPSGPAFDPAALRVFLASFDEAARAHTLACRPDLNALALVPGLLASSTHTPIAEDVVRETAPALLNRALAALQAMRVHEGQALAASMVPLLDELTALAREATSLREEAQPAHLARLASRMRALVDRDADPNRLLAEAALLAQRGDIEEELTRLHTHLAHFRAILNGGGEAGKKLDFLLQEMNREANTILSKTGGTTGAGERITVAGLAMKSAIEKLREQAQNIE